MPRNYGRIATSIWRDHDFRDLTPPARFTYMMLVTQPDVSAAGVLPIVEKRWAGNLGFTADQLGKALSELEERAYVVIDDDAQELLIRSFVKWDGGAGNDKRRHAIREAAHGVASSIVAASLARELTRQGVPHGLSDALSMPDPSVDNPEQDGASIGHRSATDTRRVVVKEGDHRNNPQPSSATREGEQPASPIPDPLGDAEHPPERPSEYCSEHPAGIEQNCGPCGTARRRAQEWDRAEAARAEAEKVEAAARRRNCSRCDDNGFVTDPDTGRPIERCDHPS